MSLLRFFSAWPHRKEWIFIRKLSLECESIHYFYSHLHLLKLAVIKQPSIEYLEYNTPHHTTHSRILPCSILLDLLLLKSSRWWHSPPLNSPQDQPDGCLWAASMDRKRITWRALSIEGFTWVTIKQGFLFSPSFWSSAVGLF